MKQNSATNVTDFYHPGDEGGLAWNDSEIGVEWPLEEGVDLIISEKDQKWKGLKDTFKFLIITQREKGNTNEGNYSCRRFRYQTVPINHGNIQTVTANL